MNSISSGTNCFCTVLKEYKDFKPLLPKNANEDFVFVVRKSRQYKDKRFTKCKAKAKVEGR